jgi:hypothetical protein
MVSPPYGFVIPPPPGEITVLSYAFDVSYVKWQNACITVEKYAFLRFITIKNKKQPIP